MTGPEHYREAEQLNERAHYYIYGDGGDVQVGLGFAAMAQVQATLALAAASEARQGYVIADDDMMRCAHGAIVCGLCGYGVPAGDGGRS